MGHCIRAIIAPLLVAESISHEWPELPCMCLRKGFAILPVDSDLIDARVQVERTDDPAASEFAHLTESFRNFLRTLSREGVLAYVETNYFGGMGGQGAVVCCDGVEVMPPTWKRFGAINAALKRIGLRRGILRDNFMVAGLHRLRTNDDIMAAIRCEFDNQRQQRLKLEK